MKRIFALLLIAAVCAFAAKAVYKPAPIGREFQILRHNINQVECCVSNYGKFGQDETGNNAGCWWPVGSNQNYIYGAGSWFGTVDVNGDSLVTIGYGPHGGESEYAPGRVGWIVSDPRAIIYMMPATWPPPEGDPELPMAPTEAKSHQDSWCVYNDADIQYHIAGDTRPIGLEVYQTVYAWNLSTTQDIIFIRYECVNTTDDTLRQCYFGVCADNDIGNEAGNAANDRISGIVGQWYVIEGESTWVDNLGYQWQEDEEPGTPPWLPGAIGFDYLQSPWDLVPGEDKDEDGIPDEEEMNPEYYQQNLPPEMWDVDLDGTMDWEDPSEIPQLGMTAFKRFTLNLEPNLDYERYTTLAGYNFRTGVYEPYDTVPPDPDDQRFLQCSGPFELDPHESAIVLVGIVFADWIGIYNRPDTALVGVDGTAQFIFDQNWLLPGPPPSPAITLLPGDARITLVWDNSAEIFEDPYYDVVGVSTSALYDPFYRQIDFEGYRVWKSNTGQTGDWELLATFDLANDIQFTDTAFTPEPLELDNGGISHIFVDEDVRNGFVYYYAVTAFDYNRVREAYDSVFAIDSTPYVYIDTLGNPDTLWVYEYDSVEVYGPRPIWFESGLSGDSVRARRDPANYVPPSDPMVEWVSGNEQLTELVDASVAYPQDIDPDYPLYIEFGPPEPVVLYFINVNGDSIPYTGARYTAYLQDDNATLETYVYERRIGVPYVPLEIVPPVNGMFINPDIGTPALPAVFPVFDSIIIESGSYPANFLVTVGSPLPYAETVADSTDMHGMWAWRGNSYQVVWSRKTPGSPVNTVTVTDLVTGEVIPYKQYQNTPSTVDLADGWCFTWHTPSTAWSKASHDTLQVDPDSFTVAERTRYLYVNGGVISLRSNSYMLDTILPDDGETWVLSANREYLPPSVYGKVRITATPGIFTDTAMTLNVKVVPNPYIISNEWQTRFVQRRVKFINLPNQCTIRIFNLNGELVRTLLHQETSEGGVGNNLGGDEWWDVLSENRQLVASGVYIFHIDSDVGEQVGKFVVVR